MKLAVVTGYAGFIGSHFTRKLLRDGWFVYGIDKNPYTEAGNEFLKFSNFMHWDDDICTVKKIPDCDFIFNFAAESHVGNSIEDSSEFIRTNVDGVRNLLELIRKKPENITEKPVFFHISTDEVYGDIFLGQHSETDLLNPSNPYSSSKSAGDMLVQAWARTYGLEYIILRPTNNYGTHQFPEKLIPLTIKTFWWGRKVRLHDKGLPMRTWLHVQDTVEAILTLIKSNARGVYNVSGPECWQNRQLVLEIYKCIFGVIPENIDNYLDLNFKRPGQDVRYAVDDNKLKQLGWSPKKRLEQELPNIVQWYLQDPAKRLFSL